MPTKRIKIIHPHHFNISEKSDMELSSSHFFEDDYISDTDLNDMMDDFEESQRRSMAGGALNFNLQPVRDRRSARLGVHERLYNTTFHQHGPLANDDNISKEVTWALQESISSVVDNDPAIQSNDRIYISLSSNRLAHSYEHRGATAEEWKNGTERAEAILNHIANLLNSNENFELNDSFNLQIVHVRRPHRGAGKRIPGSLSIHKLKQMKRSVKILPSDSQGMCLACAISASLFQSRNGRGKKWRDYSSKPEKFLEVNVVLMK